jgi:hypothetical protein
MTKADETYDTSKILSGFGNEFRTYSISKGKQTPLENTFIQNKEFRLGSMGERMEITSEKLKAQASKRVRNKQIGKSRHVNLNIDIKHPYFKPQKEFPPEEKNPITKALVRGGFDISRTMIHGTGAKAAENIRKTMRLESETFVYPGRGGFEDAKTWAEQTHKSPRVIVVKTPKKIRKTTEWITLGSRAKEREGMDTTVYGSVKISKIKILEPFGDGKLREVKAGKKSKVKWY